MPAMVINKQQSVISFPVCDMYDRITFAKTGILFLLRYPILFASTQSNGGRSVSAPYCSQPMCADCLVGAAAQNASVRLPSPYFSLNLPDVTVTAEIEVSNIKFIVGTTKKQSKQEKLCKMVSSYEVLQWKYPFLFPIYCAFLLWKHTIRILRLSSLGYQTCHTYVP